MNTPCQRRERVSRITVTLDGEPVQLLVDRLTVAEFERVATLALPRGSERSPEPTNQHLARIRVIDRHLSPAAGEVLMDDTPVTQLSLVFGAREDAINTLYHALIDAQQPNAIERQQLLVAVRFSSWLVASTRAGTASQWVETGTSCAACHSKKLCGKRGCDGTEQKKAVWHDTRLVLKVCPVRSLTPDVEHALRAFYWTHDCVRDTFGMRWHQVTLPRAGGLEDQETWLIDALAWLRQVHVQLAADEAKAATRAGATDDE